MWPTTFKSYDKEWFTFLAQFQEYEKKFLLKKKKDELLDIYSQWLKTHEKKLKNELLHLIKELSRLEPSLNFSNLLMKLEKIEV